MRHSHTLLAHHDSLIILGGKNVDGLCKEVFPMRFEEMYEYV